MQLWQQFFTMTLSLPDWLCQIVIDELCIFQDTVRSTIEKENYDSCKIALIPGACCADLEFAPVPPVSHQAGK